MRARGEVGSKGRAEQGRDQEERPSVHCTEERRRKEARGGQRSGEERRGECRGEERRGERVLSAEALQCWEEHKLFSHNGASAPSLDLEEPRQNNLPGVKLVKTGLATPVMTFLF
jgi:hypothetical protein